MRKNLEARALLYPMPVFVIGTYDENGIPNAMTAAWGGIYDTTKIGICLSRDHKTTENILKRRYFTVSMATKDTTAVSDYVGIVSGNDVPDKIEKCGLHAEKASLVDAPLFAEMPLALECELESYNQDGFMVGKIVNISADEKILSENNKIVVSRLNPITFDPSNDKYIALGEETGDAFSIGLGLE